MTQASKIIMATGAVGTAAGVGYAVSRYLRNSRSATSDQTSGAPAATDSSTEQSAFDLPLPEPKVGKRRINRSENRSGKVLQSADELLEQAREHVSQITLAELTGARLTASEHGRGNFTEKACIVDSELNRAEQNGRTLFHSLTRGLGFGKQGGKRVASTRQDPTMHDLLAARAVLSGQVRGVSLGSVRFFDPHILEKQHQKYRRWLDNDKRGEEPARVSCDALTLLETWCFDYAKKGPTRCPPDRSRTGRHTLAWVGPITGVDHLRLFLMKPMAIGPEHRRQYESARTALEQGLRHLRKH